MTLADAYRQASERLPFDLCPIEAGLIGRLADRECRHGRLPGDHDDPCGCFPEEQA